jgi:hypothetical protein
MNLFDMHIKQHFIYLPEVIDTSPASWPMSNLNDVAFHYNT